MRTFPLKSSADILCKTKSEAVAVNAVFIELFSSFITLPKALYAGRKESPHSLTQWASSMAIWLILQSFNFSITSLQERISGFARIIFVPFFMR